MAEAIESGAARVILVCPTRILVASYREKMPGLDVDSIHSAFQIFRPEQDTLDRMASFDMVVVEEVGQLSSNLFERLMRLWDAAAQRPALVFIGEFAQLRNEFMSEQLARSDVARSQLTPFAEALARETEGLLDKPRPPLVGQALCCQTMYWNACVH